MAYQVHPLHVTTGQKLNFIGDNVSGSLPGTTLLSIPVSIDIFGQTTNLMGKPAGFINVQISGIDGYRIPYYK